jgi:hypothetical protein
MASWLQIPKNSPFSLANIPFGIISTHDELMFEKFGERKKEFHGA